jgi:hypothetical protein
MAARTTPRRQLRMSLSATTRGGAYEQRTSSANSDARHESPLRFPVADVRGFVAAIATPQSGATVGYARAAALLA